MLELFVHDGLLGEDKHAIRTQVELAKPAKVVVVKIRPSNGGNGASVIVSEKGIIVTSIRGIEHSIRFQF